jgi:heptosyltransferase-2
MKKIIAITNGNIGDFVLAVSALKLLREGLSEAKITLITSRKVKDFIEPLYLADEIIYTDFSFAKRAFLQRIDQILWFLKNYFKIRNEKFDDCIFLDHSRFFAKAISLMNIKNLIGPATWWCGNKAVNPNINSLTRAVELPENSDTLHMAERYQTIARNYLNNFNLAMPLLPQTSEQTKEKVKKLLNRTKKHAIAFSLRGDNINGHKKIYPVSHTIEIIKRLSLSADADFYLLGTSIYNNDAERIISETREARVHNLCMKTSLADLKAVFEQTDLLICVDTGTIHIAATTPINIIGLYGANAYNSFPVSHRAVILHTGEKCSPCNNNMTVLNIPCPYGDNPVCLFNIKPEMVVNEANKILGEKK